MQGAGPSTAIGGPADFPLHASREQRTMTSITLNDRACATTPAIDMLASRDVNSANDFREAPVMGLSQSLCGATR
jgi:hypothetical protein